MELIKNSLSTTGTYGTGHATFFAILILALNLPSTLNTCQSLMVIHLWDLLTSLGLRILFGRLRYVLSSAPLVEATQCNTSSRLCLAMQSLSHSSSMQIRQSCLPLVVKKATLWLPVLQTSPHPSEMVKALVAVELSPGSPLYCDSISSHFCLTNIDFFKVKDDPSRSGKQKFADFKAAVWHESFKRILKCLRSKRKRGGWVECWDELQRLMFPIVPILSADYEEQCVQSGVSSIIVANM